MANYLPSVKANERDCGKFSADAKRDLMEHQDRPFADIAERLRWHRALEGLNQADYARKAGLKRSQLKNWENGDYRLSLDGALALRNTYGLSLDFLYAGIDDALSMTLRKAWRERP